MTADISGYVREHLHQTGGFAIQTWGLPWIIHDESVVLPISIPNVVAWKYCCHENCHQMRFTLHFLKLDVCVLWLNYLNSLFCCWPKHMSSPLSMAKFRDSLGTCHQVCRLLRPWSAPPGLFLRLLNTSRYRTDLKQGQIQVLLFRGGKWLEKMGGHWGHQSIWAELARKGASWLLFTNCLTLFNIRDPKVGSYEHLPRKGSIVELRFLPFMWGCERCEVPT